MSVTSFKKGSISIHFLSFWYCRITENVWKKSRFSENWSQTSFYVSRVSAVDNYSLLLYFHSGCQHRDILLLLLLLLLFCYFANRSLTDHGASLGFEKGCLYWYILGDTGAVSRARSIPGDPGAVSRAELKSATNVFKHGRKSFSAHAWKLSSRLFSRPDWLPLGLRGWDLMRLHNPISEINANPFPLLGGRVCNSSAKFRWISSKITVRWTQFVYFFCLFDSKSKQLLTLWSQNAAISPGLNQDLKSWRGRSLEHLHWRY